MKITRNQIVGAKVWAHRSQWTRHTYRKYHRILHDWRIARRIVRLIEDNGQTIDDACRRTQARDAYRSWLSNHDATLYTPYATGLSRNLRLYQAIMRGWMTMYHAQCRETAPAVWRLAIAKGIYPAHMA